MSAAIYQTDNIFGTGDRFLLNASNALNPSDAIALKQKVQDSQRLVLIEIHIAQELFLLFGESAFALITTMRIFTR